MRRLALLAATVGMLAWAAAPALSLRPYIPTAVDFEQTLDAGPGAHAAGGPWSSGVIDAPRRFDLFGLRWRSPGNTDVTVRVRRDGGRWSRWTPAGEGHGVHYGTDPVWTGGADQYEVRMSRRVHDLRVHFVNTSGTSSGLDRIRTTLRRAAHAAVVALAGSTARAQEPAPGSGAPAIIPRAAWGASQCPPRVAPSYGQVNVGIVHHTVSTNDYTGDQSAAMVLAICRYHRNANGWNDIGYNFLVDRFGQVFEGRAGGTDRAVIGAQAQGFNSLSTGVATIGTFTDVPLSAAGIQATAQLLAWKLSLHGVPVLGQVTLRSGGGDLNRFPYGTSVTLQRISAHRDVGKTECPGDLLYGQLAEIRRQAAERAAALGGPTSGTLTLTAVDRTLDYPQAAALGGVLTDAAGTAVAGATVDIQIAGKAGFVTLATALTGADGTWSATLPVTQDRTVRAVAAVPGGQATSASLAVQVAPLIAVEVPRRVVVKHLLHVTGTITPGASPLHLDVARPGSDHVQHTVARLPIKVHGRSFTASVRLQRPALTRLRVVFAGSARSSRSRSPDVYIRAIRAAAVTGGASAG